eukprot:scaffold5129_cov137-Skeletonema_dohrnii-CCMP3373.AAC.7
MECVVTQQEGEKVSKILVKGCQRYCTDSDAEIANNAVLQTHSGHVTELLTLNILKQSRFSGAAR